LKKSRESYIRQIRPRKKQWGLCPLIAGCKPQEPSHEEETNDGDERGDLLTGEQEAER
jgi:hypothetical protein